MNTTEELEHLFSYGTLQTEAAWCLGYGFRAYAAGDRPSAKAEIPAAQQDTPPDESGE